jgi:hypothetical protein
MSSTNFSITIVILRWGAIIKIFILAKYVNDIFLTIAQENREVEAKKLVVVGAINDRFFDLYFKFFLPYTFICA